MMFEIGRAAAATAIAQIELNISISRCRKGDLLRDLRMEWGPAKIGVQNNPRRVHDNLQPATTMLLQFLTKRLHERVEIDCGASFAQSSQLSPDGVENYRAR